MRVRWRNLELPNRVTFERDHEDPHHGTFYIEPFERGFGHTVGNSLRRILLSSIEGSAISAVRIQGVAHEISSIKGVYEDVIDLVLNLKRVLIKSSMDDPFRMRLDARKKGPVTAGQIEAPAGVTIVNPNMVIATLTEDVNFVIEMEVKRGRGYVTAEENDTEEQEIGRIAVDSIFSPVQRVRYRTENTRVGKLVDYDRLILEIWTNGTLDPEHALVEASKIMRKHLNPFINYFELGSAIEHDDLIKGEEDKQREEQVRKVRMPVSDLELSVRTSHCLDSASIRFVGELVARHEPELLKIRNFGRTSLKEIKKKVTDLALHFGMDVHSVLGLKEGETLKAYFDALVAQQEQPTAASGK